MISRRGLFKLLGATLGSRLLPNVDMLAEEPVVGVDPARPGTERASVCCSVTVSDWTLSGDDIEKYVFTGVRTEGPRTMGGLSQFIYDDEEC